MDCRSGLNAYAGDLNTRDCEENLYWEWNRRKNSYCCDPVLLDIAQDLKDCFNAKYYNVDHRKVSRLYGKICNLEEEIQRFVCPSRPPIQKRQDPVAQRSQAKPRTISYKLQGDRDRFLEDERSSISMPATVIEQRRPKKRKSKTVNSKIPSYVMLSESFQDPRYHYEESNYVSPFRIKKSNIREYTPIEDDIFLSPKLSRRDRMTNTSPVYQPKAVLLRRKYKPLTKRRSRFGIYKSEPNLNEETSNNDVFLVKRKKKLPNTKSNHPDQYHVSRLRPVKSDKDQVGTKPIRYSKRNRSVSLTKRKPNILLRSSKPRDYDDFDDAPPRDDSQQPSKWFKNKKGGEKRDINPVMYVTHNFDQLTAFNNSFPRSSSESSIVSGEINYIPQHPNKIINKSDSGVGIPGKHKKHPHVRHYEVVNVYQGRTEDFNVKHKTNGSPKGHSFNLVQDRDREINRNLKKHERASNNDLQSNKNLTLFTKDNIPVYVSAVGTAHSPFVPEKHNEYSKNAVRVGSNFLIIDRSSLEINRNRSGRAGSNTPNALRQSTNEEYIFQQENENKGQDPSIKSTLVREHSKRLDDDFEFEKITRPSKNFSLESEELNVFQAKAEKPSSFAKLKKSVSKINIFRRPSRKSVATHENNETQEDRFLRKSVSKTGIPIPENEFHGDKEEEVPIHVIKQSLERSPSHLTRGATINQNEDEEPVQMREPSRGNIINQGISQRQSIARTPSRLTKADTIHQDEEEILAQVNRQSLGRTPSRLTRANTINQYDEEIPVQEIRKSLARMPSRLTRTNTIDQEVKAIQSLQGNRQSLARTVSRLTRANTINQDEEGISSQVNRQSLARTVSRLTRENTMNRDEEEMPVQEVRKSLARLPSQLKRANTINQDEEVPVQVTRKSFSRSPSQLTKVNTISSRRSKANNVIPNEMEISKEANKGIRKSLTKLFSRSSRKSLTPQDDNHQSPRESRRSFFKRSPSKKSITPVDENQSPPGSRKSFFKHSTSRMSLTPIGSKKPMVKRGSVHQTKSSSKFRAIGRSVSKFLTGKKKNKTINQEKEPIRPVSLLRKGQRKESNTDETLIKSMALEDDDDNSVENIYIPPPKRKVIPEKKIPQQLEGKTKINSGKEICDEPLNYSLHYTKEKRRCIETSSIPSNLTIPDVLPPNCRKLLSVGKIVLSEHKLNGKQINGRYYEVLGDPKYHTYGNNHDCKVCKSMVNGTSMVNGHHHFKSSIDEYAQSDSDSTGKAENFNRKLPADYFSDSIDISWDTVVNEIKQKQ